VRPLLKPRWIAGHLLAVVAVVSFVPLGLWQLRRHDEKSDLRARVAEAQALDPVLIEDLSAGEYRTVIARGEYDAAMETRVLRSQAGSSGYLVLTPLLLPDGSGVLVDRGWAPLDGDYRGGGSAPSGIVTVTGTLWPAEEGSSIPPDLAAGDDGLPTVVRRIDPEIQGAFTDYSLRNEYLVLTGSSPPPGDLAVPDQPEVSLGPHLGYALQWFAFAVIVVIGYPLLLRRTVAASATLAGDDPDGDDPDSDGLDEARALVEEPPGE
jgi:cytochrome oxidase assembly protein ShyY1